MITNVPITTGGNRKRTQRMHRPTTAMATPPANAAPNTDGSPWVLAIGIITGTKPKLVPITTGNRAPMRPTPSD
ncbi:hypothetical protein KBTX_01841 [wastewater metagenome]|uniref:Uncharacterized protein n=2 Tax=unclassified sequences TaxID=12908 RepID=A0A5B8RC92_9ZZZZ|nr:hypothetical protein KBTEX_01841 [uncultured organism]